MFAAPHGPDQRRHPRVELFVQVQVSRDSECYIMSTANISRGGLFIGADPWEHPDLVQGATVDLCIFSGNDLAAADAHLRARIVRVVRPGALHKPGFGLEFVIPLPAEQSQALDELLLAASSR